MPISYRSRVLTIMGALIPVVVGGCQATRPHDPGDGIFAPQAPLREKAARSIVEKALPQWNERVLEVREGPDWTRKLDFATVFESMHDKMPDVDEIPKQARKIEGKDRMVSIDRGRGKIRYVNRQRAWSFEKDAAKTRAIPEKKAQAMILEAVGRLGIPNAEIGEPRIDTQIAAGAPAGAKEIQDRFEMYRVVTIPRTIGGLPVYGSRLRAAIANQGQIQRLRAEWPAFRMGRQMKLLSRETVVDRAVREIMAQDPERGLRVQAYLAYSPVTQDDEEMTYAPSVIISVYSGPTPYQLVLPVAE